MSEVGVRGPPGAGLYIGSSDSRGLMHCLREIIDNAADEALAGACDHVEVILHDDGSVGPARSRSMNGVACCW